LASYRRAVAALQSVRQDIPVEYHGGQSSYRTTFGPLYLEYGDLLLRRAAADPARSDDSDPHRRELSHPPPGSKSGGERCGRGCAPQVTVSVPSMPCCL
jgi:hypothetical protein